MDKVCGTNGGPTWQRQLSDKHSKYYYIPDSPFTAKFKTYILPTFERESIS